MYVLDNPVQHYDWGSPTAIPHFLGVPNPEGKPWAELWMGTHPKGASIARDVRNPARVVPLADVLGMDGADESGLPFLFKILAAAKPLSIQAHPSLVQAQEGYRREEAAGIAWDDRTRSYRDSNHKPELICALTEFHAMKGFRPWPEILEVFRDPLFADLSTRVEKSSDLPETEALRNLIRGLFELDAHARSAVLQAAKKRADTELSLNRALPEPRFVWLQRLLREYPDDIGAVAPL